ncbi:hypothetical protein [Humibacter ginsenosidimutans]|uniref:Uncharacterized protein n=1 Tax=Humibacter ginsenosidimutans TaxID=2599293 RepID=A0A5B8M703_9MICO|nr:hypothetical protein [Humibacter ginsenosidimutans]QDZ15774.1 hypothetical protein FPZ11_14290 [Humibacter ginsenosidimutans]
MGYQWVATRLTTGEQICDLNDLVVDEVLDTIGRYEMVNATLPIPTADPDWERATLEGATAYWLLQDYPAGGVPLIIWGGYIVTSQRDETDVVTLTLATFPGYLDARYTGDRTYAATDQNALVTDLITNCVAAGPAGGVPMRVQVVGGAGMLRDHTYLDSDDKTVYQALQDAMNWENGPEWWIGGEWQGQLINPVLYVGNRLGTPASPSPEAVFDMPGNCTKFQRVQSFGSGKGANSVMAYASGIGATRLQSPVEYAADPERPTFEYRWSPSSSITDVNTLINYAAAALPNMQNGSRSLTMSAAADQDATPGYCSRWVLGDDVGYDINTPSFPRGFTGTARAIGMRLTLGNTRTLTPVLVGGDLEE